MEVILKLCPNPEFQGLSLKETQALYKHGTAQLSTVLIQATATAVLSDMELLGGCRVPCPSINPGTHTGFWLGCGCCQASLEHTACRDVCSPGSSRGKHRQSTCRPAISSGLLRGTGPKGPQVASSQPPTVWQTVLSVFPLTVPSVRFFAGETHCFIGCCQRTVNECPYSAEREVQHADA